MFSYVFVLLDPKYAYLTVRNGEIESDGIAHEAQLPTSNLFFDGEMMS